MSMTFRWILVAAAVGCAADTGSTNKNTSAKGPEVSSDSLSGVSAASVSSADSRDKVTVLFFGTSLTAGYGLDPSIAFPNLVARKSDSTATPITAINAGLSGETSAGALRRIDWALGRPVDVVVLETGGNDALRALDPDSLEANIRGIVSRIRTVRPQARILLVVMESPPNLGARYNERFRQAYSNVAKSENVTLAPFLLDRVAGIDSLNQSDQVHPNEKGERIVAGNVWRALEPVVREVYSNRSKG
jgi:acyl-CoA thioesterase-1